jgi:hypothetical protein
LYFQNRPAPKLSVSRRLQANSDSNIARRRWVLEWSVKKLSILWLYFPQVNMGFEQLSGNPIRKSCWMFAAKGLTYLKELL